MKMLRNVISIMKELRRRSLSHRVVLACPICGHSDIIQIKVGGITPVLYLCKHCGYKGYLVLEVDRELPEA